MRYTLLILIALLTSIGSTAQCDENQTEVFITVYLDAWGYENYWELLPSGELCGGEALFIGGNVEQVGCDGAGDQDATGGNGYASNTSFTEGPFCLANGEAFDIVWVDDYNDGGSVFEVLQEGIITGYFEGSGAGNTFTFTAGDLTPAFIDGDRPCEALTIIEDGDNLIFDTSEATTSPGEVAPEGGFCGGYGEWCDSNGGASNTVWAVFTPETTGNYEVSTCNEGNTFDTALAVYTAEDCSDFSSYTLVSSNDDSYIGCGAGSTGFASICYLSCVEIGQSFYIQVDGWGGENGVTELSVTSYDSEPELVGITRDVRCANLKQDLGSLILPQVNGMGINYEIEWTGPNDFESTERRIEDLNPGSYTCTITDACGFQATQTYEIGIPDPVLTESIVTPVTCSGLTDGSVDLALMGGIEPYEFEWSGPDNYLSLEEDIQGLADGAYAVLVTDDNDCEYTFSYTVEVGNSIEFSLGENVTLCLDEVIDFQGPLGFYTYEWQDGSENSILTFDASEFGEGTHTVTLTIEDPNGCSHTDVSNVTVENCLFVDEHFNSDELTLYPNPANDWIKISSESSIDHFEVELVSVEGKSVLHRTFRKDQEIDLTELEAGLYLVRIQAGESIFSSQLLKLD